MAQRGDVLDPDELSPSGDQSAGLSHGRIRSFTRDEIGRGGAVGSVTLETRVAGAERRGFKLKPPL